MPQRHGTGGLVHFPAAARGDGKHRSCLSEVVGPREPTSKDGRAQTPELALCVPPPRQVHLAYTRHNDAQLHQTLDVHCQAGFAPSCLSTLVIKSRPGVPVRGEAVANLTSTEPPWRHRESGLGRRRNLCGSAERFRPLCVSWRLNARSRRARSTVASRLVRKAR